MVTSRDDRNIKLEAQYKVVLLAMVRIYGFVAQSIRVVDEERGQERESIGDS